MSVLHHGVPDIAQLGSLPSAFLVQPCIRIGATLMRGIRALLATEVHPPIGWVVTRSAASLRWWLILGPETLQAGRGFDQRAIHGEVLIAQQVQPIGLHDHLVEELAADVRTQ